MRIEKLRNYSSILIAGYGKEGEATEQFLKKFVPDAKITITDQKDGENYLDKQFDFDLVIKHQAIPKELIKQRYTTAANIFFANVQNMKIGITGTKGKSTTSSLIYDVMKTGGKKARLVGNIGKPMIAELLTEIASDVIFVIELSSYQLDDILYSPHISVIVNLFPEHMNYHQTVQKYYDAKKRILAHVNVDDYFVYNPRFSELVAWANSTYCKTVPYIQELPFDISESRLIGEHNKENIRAAVTVGQILGIEEKAMQKAVVQFQPLRHRLQKVGEFKGITFYDDAISTTPESTIAAISSLKRIGTIFLGGLNRGYDFSELIPCLKEYNISNVVLFPESGKQIKELLDKEQAYKPHLFETSDMKEAVAFGYEQTKPGDICLLSTASPSYSIWKNFEEKGDLFQKYVKELGV